MSIVLGESRTMVLARPFTDTAMVRLTIKAATDIITVTRADVNGTRPVRTRTGILPHLAVDGDLILEDYEAAAGNIVYTVTAADGTMDSTTTTLTLDAPWIFIPIQPQYSERLQSIIGYNGQRQSLSTEFQPLGRSDTLTIMRPMGPRRGTLRAVCGTFGDAQAVEATSDRGEILMLRQPEHAGMDMYFVAKSTNIVTLTAAGGRTLFGVDVEYLAVERPYGDLSGSLGWDFEGVAATYADFAAVSAAYADFGALALNEVTQ